ncbi:unnamed protein product [Pelagomonas calceolata]|uniref:Uncharacterized protein n=1 Tax=Pelagomonas calceolata TaxID=35677 RepID=A0A8J2SXP1_9STRA|nr:unnamed protein product [Pelagomonas calceolata]|mmetsp:Transcript_10904/g.33699  ORF Transcript_10904/g.33699 Transcript_10904/m.33699 type:complete len:301 (+) Transcript_10904:146-1048(+)
MAEDSEEDRPDLRMVKDVVTGYTVRWHEHVSPTNHLVNAASFKDPALLRKALAAGADPNHVTGYHQATPLHELARVSPPTFGKRTSAECIAILVEAGADPNSRDRYDETPLQKYLRLHGQFPRWYENSLEIVQAFILGGADVNAPCGNTSILHLAVIADHAGCVALLLAAGATVDIEGRYEGYSRPTHLGPGQNYAECRTPLDFAILHGQNGTRRTWPILLCAGARVPDLMTTPLGARCFGDFPRPFPFLQRVVAAGGYKAYAKAVNASLAKLFAPKLPVLPEEIFPRIASFWAHAPRTA